MNELQDNNITNEEKVNEQREMEIKQYSKTGWWMVGFA
jgi:hypothetical protein